jgi:hypothetical protein
MGRRLLLSLLTAVCVLQITVAQSPTPALNKTSPKPVDNQSPSKEREEAIVKVRALSEELFRFENKLAAALAAARMADLLWTDDTDYGRRLFERAIDLSTPVSDSSKRDFAAASYIRGRIIALINKRDTQWARRLLHDANRADEGFNTAYQTLRDNPDKAAELAELNLPRGVSRGMPSFLLQLRLKNPAAADALFLKTLAQLVSQPAADISVMLSLGTYVFTSPRLHEAPGLGVEQIGVDRFFVPNITTLRRNVPVQLARIYLAGAGTILNSPVVDPNQKALRYVLAYLLLPHVTTIAPELIVSFSTSMAMLSSQVPPTITSESTYKGFSPTTPKSFEEILEEIERLSGDVQRDQRYLGLCFEEWRNGRYDRARLAASKITNAETKAKLTRLIDFREAIQQLQSQKNLAFAESIASRPPSGVETALLYLAIAKAKKDANDRDGALEALTASMKFIKMVNDARRPYLTLSVASQLVAIDPGLAVTKLTDAVQEFNRQPQEALLQIDWAETVKVGPAVRRFPLEVKGLDFALGLLFQPVIKSEPDVASQAIHGLKSEELRAEGFVALALNLLNSN